MYHFVNVWGKKAEILLAILPFVRDMQVSLCVSLNIVILTN